MRGSIGQLLVQRGVIDAGALSDALARQGGRHPVASELYALGHATERQLAMALAVQTGWPGIVLDESTLRLDVLAQISPEWARLFNALVVHEDATTLVIAAARPEDAIVPARELGEARGKRVELRIALELTLSRTIRVAFKRWKQGELFLIGTESERADVYLAIVQPDEGEHDEHRQAQRALAEEAARSIEIDDELPSEDGPQAGNTLPGDWQISGISSTTLPNEQRLLDDRTLVLSAELDRFELEVDGGRMRALIMDPDPSARIQLAGELERLGYECHAVATGAQALDLLSQLGVELVLADVATPDIDGLRLCRAIKLSRRMSRCRVIVTTSVVDSGQVPDAVLQQHGADGYLEKPLDLRRLHRLLREPSAEERQDHEPIIADALGRYHRGDLEGAIARLRDALGRDGSSPKVHFMLANMLQRASRWPEAIDEYEVVVELQPTYFPALTRLAYLYFRQGLYARAVETWRRALPVCEDPTLRRNIELFMRKLVADMAKSDASAG